MPLEQDKQGGFKFSLKEMMPSGLYPSVFARKAPLWRTGENIQFTQQGVQKIPGWSLLVDTAGGGPIRGILQTLEDDGTSAIIYAGDLDTIYRIDTQDPTAEVVGTGFNLSDASGSAVWDSGASTWDGGDSTWDYGVIRASHWSFAPFGEWVLAAYGGPPVIRKGSGDFVEMYQGVTGGLVTTAGTGYAVDDVLTCTGGDGTGALAVVTSVDGGGGILTVGMTDGGSGYTTAPTGFTEVSGGSGAAITWTVSDIDVSTVDIFRVSGPHVLGFNTSTSPKEFIWCDADDPDTWIAASDNLAGQLEIRELQSPIRAAVPLGSRIAVYGNDQMFLVSYLANDLVFGYQPALNGIGAVSKKAVVPVGRQNYGLSEQGFFITDGQSFEYIDEPAIRTYYEETANKGQLSKAVAYHDEENTQVRWFFPTSSAMITGGVSFNYKTNTWSILTAPWSAGDERRVVEGPIIASETGEIYKSQVGNNEDGAAMTAWVRSKPLDMDNADIIKELDSIRIGYVGDGLTYRLGWSETEDGTINWKDYQAMDTGFTFQNLRTAGRWLHFELKSTTLNSTWEVADIVFIGRMEGTR